MSSADDRKAPETNGRISPPAVTPNYENPVPNPPANIESVRKTRCATGLVFARTIHGVLNLIIIVALVCVLISAGVSNPENARDADKNSSSNAKVNAFHTRNAVLVLASFGLFLILVDTILHMTRLINRLPGIFDMIFIVVMLVFAAIFLILGCCAAAWEQKMRDSREKVDRPAAAAVASFFLFVAMIATVIDFGLRLIRPNIRTIVK